MKEQSKGKHIAKILMIIIGTIVLLYVLGTVALLAFLTPMGSSDSIKVTVAEQSVRYSGKNETTYDRAMPEPGSPEMIAGAQERKIQREADLRVRVDSIPEAMQAAIDLAQRLGGFASSSSIHIHSGAGGEITIRVPEARMDEAIAELSALGRLLSRNIYQLDITEQYVDVEARLRNLRATEERLVAILDRTGEIADVLATEKEISRVRGEIEQLQAQLRNLDSLTTLATIRVSFLPEQSDLQPGTLTLGDSPSGFAKAFVASINKLNALAAGFVVIIGALLPFLIALTVILTPVTLWIIRRRRASANRGEETDS
ncbi:MAG: DUF4349 domain-containing protein [Candidatus Desulforudis sp.]|nr:DUF4349 domain-containing protein [Desulforudis sp.]